MNAFDADCLIYAASPNNPLGDSVHQVILDSGIPAIGSVLLLPEVLIKPTRLDRFDEQQRLIDLLAGIELLPVEPETARTAVALGAKYGLSSIDSVHLATAVVAGADRFITNNRRDFGSEIDEIEIVYPADL